MTSKSDNDQDPQNSNSDMKLNKTSETVSIMQRGENCGYVKNRGVHLCDENLYCEGSAFQGSVFSGVCKKIPNDVIYLNDTIEKVSKYRMCTPPFHVNNCYFYSRNPDSGNFNLKFSQPINVDKYCYYFNMEMDNADKIAYYNSKFYQKTR